MLSEDSIFADHLAMARSLASIIDGDVKLLSVAAEHEYMHSLKLTPLLTCQFLVSCPFCFY